MGTRLKIAVERSISPRVQKNSYQRSLHKKETLQMKSQDFLSHVPEFSFLCLLLVGFGALDTFLSYSASESSSAKWANGSHRQALL